MKKLLLILTSLAVLVCLAGCAADNAVEYIEVDDTADVTEEEQDEINAVWSHSDSGWSCYIDGEMCTGTVEFNGVQYTFTADGIWDGNGYLTLTAETSDDTGETTASVVDEIKSVDGAEEIYCGCYLDDGMKVIVSTNVEKMNEILSELFPGYIELMVTSGDYNEEQLEATKEAVSEKVSEYGIAVYTDVETCRIVIQIPEVTEELTDFVNSLEYGGCIEIEIVDSIETDEDDLEVLSMEFTSSEISAFCKIMTDCSDVAPGTAGSSLRSVSAAGSLLDWAEDVKDKITAESVAALLLEWQSGCDDWNAEDMKESWASVAGSIVQIITDPTDESLLGLLDDAGYALLHDEYSEDLVELITSTIEKFIAG